MKPVHTLYRKTIRPRSVTADDYRRELIINILLAGLLAITMLALATSLLAVVFNENFNGLLSIIITLVFLVVLVGCRYAVYRGRIRLASLVLIGIMFIAISHLMLRWSFMVPMALVGYMLIIVIGGILLGTRAGLLVTAATIVCISSIALLQISQVFTPDYQWMRQLPTIFDAAGYGLVFGLAGLVSWLSNREIGRALLRAHQSEAALMAERDNLERAVAARTRQLEETQLIRVMELERLAEFGRTHAVLIHDISNPLMAVTLDLASAGTPAADLGFVRDRLAQANHNITLIEQHVASARRHLRGDSQEDVWVSFSVDHEIRQAVAVIKPLADAVKVALDVQMPARLRLYGDAVAFNQIVSNLLVNAVEAYGPDGTYQRRLVRLCVQATDGGGLSLQVFDWGGGIPAADLDHIFDLLYSRKPAAADRVNTGIGLNIVKRAVEQDFNGSIHVSSDPGKGTCFSLELHAARR